MTPLEYDKMWAGLNERRENLEAVVNMSEEELLAAGPELCNALKSLAITILIELDVRRGGFDL